jgi:hypothetical protein
MLAHGSGVRYGGCGSWKLAQRKKGVPAAWHRATKSIDRSAVQVE